jgi:transketolase
MQSVTNLQKTANILRKNIIEMIGPVHRGHYGGSFSCAEIMTSLYFYKMKHDPQNPSLPDRDRFIISKGHSGLAQYAALGECGYFPKEEFKTLKELGSRLQGHPDMRKLPGIEANTGSLGQGLSLGNGIAKALKMDDNKATVYVLLGDGELGEGQVWEAAMFSAHYKLDNVVAIVDKNNIQAMGCTSDRMSSSPIDKKFEAFGWTVHHADGHNMTDLVSVLDKCDERAGKPKVIIAETIKGKGLKIGENLAAYHNNGLTQEQYDQAIADLNAAIGGKV